MALARTALSKPRGSAYNSVTAATEPHARTPGDLVHHFPRMAKLDIQLLGEFSLVHQGAPLTTVNTARLQSLLAYLVLNRRAPQTRQRIAFLLWTDSPEPQARTNLRNLLFALNKALPGAEEFLLNDAQTLQWKCDSSYTLDVEEFERAAEQTASPASLERAVHLYRGELLPGMYDDWIVRERERLDTLYTQSLERLVREYSGNGTNDRALEYARLLIKHDPLREDTYRDLMMLYARRGDRAGVRRVYEKCVDALKRELDVEPSAETRRAYHEALRFEPPPHVRPAAPQSVPVNETPALLSPAPHIPSPPADKKRGLSDLQAKLITVAVPALVLIVLIPFVPRQPLPLIAVFSIALLFFFGLYFILVHRPAMELEKQKTQDEIRKSLNGSRVMATELFSLASEISKVDVQRRVLNISGRAAQLLEKIESDKFRTLTNANELDRLLSDTRQLVNAYLRMVKGQLAAPPDVLAARSETIERDGLPGYEKLFDQFAFALDRGDLMELETAIRMLGNRLKEEGIDKGARSDSRNGAERTAPDEDPHEQ